MLLLYGFCGFGAYGMPKWDALEVCWPRFGFVGFLFVSVGVDA
jgi:hypothetical protein